MANKNDLKRISEHAAVTLNFPNVKSLPGNVSKLNLSSVIRLAYVTGAEIKSPERVRAHQRLKRRRRSSIFSYRIVHRFCFKDVCICLELRNTDYAFYALKLGTSSTTLKT